MNSKKINDYNKKIFVFCYIHYFFLKKHDTILMLAKSKFNSIETLVWQALIDMERSHEEFITILKEKDKYEKIKDNLRSENEKYEIMRLSSIKSRT